MPDLVRIRDKNTGTEYSVGARRAEQLVERGGVEVVKDGDATDKLGRALPAAETTTKSKTASKESSR
ncbi:hypothetical protein ABZ793_12215 [Micromonospora sp. NPDC047465]|uniref:hypothetical protein n=1 Tax=Micromonospora sp. NPDC047465 TaxID=3154813 RepID=UPI0033F2CFF3